ncbi:MAG TPA: type II secretion system protein GspK, partial [Longimicrobium sp.]
IAVGDETLARELASVRLAPGTSYSAQIRDAEARLDINVVSEGELRELFQAVGAGFHAADVAAQSVLDWRDPDELHRGRGAEWDDYYSRLPVPVHPRNGPLESIEELRDVRGMERLSGAVAPYVTTYAVGRVNLNTAPAPVLRTIPGLDRESVDLILGRRHGVRPLRDVSELQSQLSGRSREHLQRHLGEFRARADFDSDILEVTSTGAVDGLPFTRTIRALVTRNGSSVVIFRTFEE